MPTPNLTSACEYARGSISRLNSAKYLRYFISEPPRFPFRFSPGEIAGSRGPSVFLSEAPTYLERAGREKVGWLISAILREINHLADKTGCAGDRSRRPPPTTGDQASLLNQVLQRSISPNPTLLR